MRSLEEEAVEEQPGGCRGRGTGRVPRRDDRRCPGKDGRRPRRSGIVGGASSTMRRRGEGGSTGRRHGRCRCEGALTRFRFASEGPNRGRRGRTTRAVSASGRGGTWSVIVLRCGRRRAGHNTGTVSRLDMPQPVEGRTASTGQCRHQIPRCPAASGDWRRRACSGPQ